MGTAAHATLRGAEDGPLDVLCVFTPHHVHDGSGFTQNTPGQACTDGWPVRVVAGERRPPSSCLVCAPRMQPGAAYNSVDYFPSVSFFAPAGTAETRSVIIDRCISRSEGENWRIQKPRGPARMNIASDRQARFFEPRLYFERHCRNVLRQKETRRTEYMHMHTGGRNQISAIILFCARVTAKKIV